MTVEPIKFERVISKIGGALKVNIPKEIADHCHLEQGDTVFVYVCNGNVVVEKKKVIK